MKTLVFFSRTCTVPGGSRILRQFEKKPEQEPVVLRVFSRLVYKVYARDRAVVYTGIDIIKATKYAAQEIIRMIVDRENIPDPLAWSFYDLSTSLGYENIPVGDYECNIVFLKPDTMPVEVEGGAFIEDCSFEEVLKDFHVFIYNTQFARHEKLTMKAFQRARYDRDFDLDDADDTDDDGGVSSDDADGPTQNQ